MSAATDLAAAVHAALALPEAGSMDAIRDRTNLLALRADYVAGALSRRVATDEGTAQAALVIAVVADFYPVRYQVREGS